MQNYDVVIVGGGSAGSSAATVLSRNRWKVLVVDRSLEDGFLGSHGNVSYFPGIIESTSGSDLVRKFRKQAELVGVSFKSARAQKITADGERPSVTIDTGDVIGSRALILASGAAMRTNYLHGEKEFLGRGVSHDAATDGPIFSHRRVAVIGKNQHTAEEALRVERFASHVIFIVPSSKVDAEESVQKRLRESKKIEMFLSTSLKKINGTDHVNSITVFTGGSEKDIEVNGVFPYVHDYQPTNDYLKDSVELSDNGSVKVTNEFVTTAKGVFACGDVLCSRPQLPAISCAQGILAAMSVNNYLIEGA